MRDKDNQKNCEDINSTKKKQKKKELSKLKKKDKNQLTN
jgi:hypothetical protein